MSDRKRVGLRFLQTLVVAVIAYAVPNFGDVVSLDILSEGGERP